MKSQPDLPVCTTTLKRVCGAKTKDGTPCQKLPCTGRTRCRLHGGASLTGIGHPNYKHGYYSVSVVGAVLRGAERHNRRINQAMLQAGARWSEEQGRWTFLPPKQETP